MQFNQLKIFQLPKPITLKSAQVIEKLTPLQFNHCLPSLPFSYGWVSPYSQEQLPLVHEHERCLLFAMQLEEKLLPSAVVNQELTRQVQTIETERQHKMSAKERRALKDQVTHTLLPRAFSKFSKLYVYFDFAHHWLLVNTVRKTRLDKFHELFKRTFPELNIAQLVNKQLIEQLTRWLTTNKLPEKMAITTKLVLKDPQQKQHVIRLNHTEPELLPLDKLFKQGFHVFQLGLSLDNAVEFLINEDSTFSNIRFHDEIKQELKNQYNESPLSQLNADFYLQTKSFSHMIELLLNEKKTG